MKPARIFQQYIWIVNALRKHKRLTLKELSDKWVDDEVADGNPMPRSSFNKYRDGIFDMFGLVIECDSTHHYFISNPSKIDKDQTKQWMLSMLTTGLTLSSRGDRYLGHSSRHTQVPVPVTTTQ